ncbi:hypothetical protein CK203_096789 [Vitis vinifera]|uniref:Uncharacterized protein n=1 Tax=Vitis vinifera TaxID=29760 RepID=A0A438D103_VITVI|nr:hypothetical protein CK203_096789 [Vitis vinifera]
MLKLVNTFGMDEIELYIEQVSVQPRVKGQLLEQMKMKKNVNPKKMMIKVREQKMFNMMVMSSSQSNESEQGRYVSVDRKGCDMSNNLDPEDPIEFSPIQYHSALSLQFENVENIGDVVSSDWTPRRTLILETQLLALRCKKAEQSQCPWKLRAVVVKDRYPSIMVAMSDVHLGWSEPYAYHKEYTPYVDAKIKANVVKVGSHEIVLYDHIQGQFHVKTNRVLRVAQLVVEHIASTYMIDFRPLVQHYYSTQSYYNTWAPLFHPIFNVYEWPPYDGPIIMPSESMKRASSRQLKSSRFHNEMDVREGKTSITWVTLPTSEIKISAISTRWLCHQFSHPPVDSDDATLERCGLGRDYTWVDPIWSTTSPLAAQHLEHDAADDLPAKHLDQGL